MKRTSCIAFSLAIAFAFAVSSMRGADSREWKRLKEGKITKNEAQHLVLQKFPGAKIIKCELQPANDHSVWIVDVMKSGDPAVSKVQVDGLSGKITP